MLIVIDRAGYSSLAQQLVHGVDRAANDALNRAHRHAFAEQFQNLDALGGRQLVHIREYMNVLRDTQALFSYSPMEG